MGFYFYSKCFYLVRVELEVYWIDDSFLILIYDNEGVFVCCKG